MANKYGARKCTWGGEHFDSQKERDRFIELLALEQAGAISELSRQPRFLLLEGFRHACKPYRPIHYTADFRYIENGRVVIEESKGKRTRDYIMREKMFVYQYLVQEDQGWEYRVT